MEDSHKQKPRLERRNAMKNIDFQVHDSFHEDRNSDLSPSLLKQTTFRIHGNEQEFLHIFQSLGLSGPEDFSIPTAAWEQSQKSRFTSDSLLSSSNNNKKKLLSTGVGLNSDDVIKSPIFHQNGVEGYETSKGVGLNSDLVLKNPSFHQHVVEGLEKKDHGIIKVNVFSNSSKVLGGGGIKGVRPPVLEILDDIPLDETDVEENEKDYSDVGGESENDSSIVDDSLHNVSPNGSFRTTFSSWQKGEILGKGSFGTVYEGFTDDGIFFAVKEVSLVDEGSQAKQSIFQLQQEISLLSQFEHENIVRYFGTDKDNNMLYIFLELVTKGSLASLYQKYRLSDSQVSAYTRQILSGLKYLHDRNVVHRDIKCANILVDANGSVKLADFGLAKATKLNDVKSSKGSPYWMAPEVVNLRNRGYGLAADIWSLGCTVLEMLTRQPPYSHLEGMQALFRIGRGQPPPVPETLSKNARDFILKCLEVNPSKRPTSAQLLDHPFVKRSLLSPMNPISPRVNLLMS